MTTPLLKRTFWVAAVIAAAAEGVVIYRQWPPPPLKICASVEFGELLAAAAKLESELRAARSGLRTSADVSNPKEIMRLEAAAAAAYNDVANYKQRALERQRARGAAARDGACS